MAEEFQPISRVRREHKIPTITTYSNKDIHRNSFMLFMVEKILNCVCSVHVHVCVCVFVCSFLYVYIFHFSLLSQIIAQAVMSLGKILVRRNLPADELRAQQVLSIAGNPMTILSPSLSGELPCETLSFESIIRWIHCECTCIISHVSCIISHVHVLSVMDVTCTNVYYKCV